MTRREFRDFLIAHPHRLRHAVFAKGKPEVVSIWAGATLVMASVILKLYLGDDWYERNISNEKNAFLLKAASPSKAGVEEIANNRVIELAEMVYNLHGSQGFDDYVNDVADRRSDPDAVYGELIVGKLLRVFGHEFRFLTPRGHSRLPDFSVAMNNGVEFFVEVATKLETTSFRAETVQSTLQQKAYQLQHFDSPKLLAISLPQNWLYEYMPACLGDMPKLIEETLGERAACCFRELPHVDGVTFFSQIYVRDGEAPWNGRCELRALQFVNAESGLDQRRSTPVFDTPNEACTWKSLYDLASPNA